MFHVHVLLTFDTIKMANIQNGGGIGGGEEDTNLVGSSFSLVTFLLISNTLENLIKFVCG